jgi:hypothetical protein
VRHGGDSVTAVAPVAAQSTGVVNGPFCAACGLVRIAGRDMADCDVDWCQNFKSAQATDADALRHLLASLHERLIYADDALALGAIKHLEKALAFRKRVAHYLVDAPHVYTDCGDRCTCGLEELQAEVRS